MVFSQDLTFGQSFEHEFLKHIEYDTFIISEGKFKEYDLKICKDANTTYYEIKADRIAYMTKNIAIEYKCSGISSGIRTTTSDFYGYFLVEPSNKYSLYIIPTSKIKEYIQAKQYKRKCKGGDNGKSCMYLFDLVVFNSFKK